MFILNNRLFPTERAKIRHLSCVGAIRAAPVECGFFATYRVRRGSRVAGRGAGAGRDAGVPRTAAGVLTRSPRRIDRPARRISPRRHNVACVVARLPVLFNHIHRKGFGHYPKNGVQTVFFNLQKGMS